MKDSSSPQTYMMDTSLSIMRCRVCGCVSIATLWETRRCPHRGVRFLRLELKGSAPKTTMVSQVREICAGFIETPEPTPIRFGRRIRQ